MTPQEIEDVNKLVSETLTDTDDETITQVVDLITSRFEFVRERTKQELMNEIAKISDKIAQLTMDEIDYNNQINNA